MMGALLVVRIVAFIRWHRRRRHIHQTSAPSSTAMRSVSGIGLTSFTLTHPDAAATHGDRVSWMTLQQLRSGSPEAVGANVDADGTFLINRPSHISEIIPIFVPVGLSAKMLARMRVETLHSGCTSVSRSPSFRFLPPSGERQHRHACFGQFRANLIGFGARSSNFVPRCSTRKLHRAMRWAMLLKELSPMFMDKRPY